MAQKEWYPVDAERRLNSPLPRLATHFTNRQTAADTHLRHAAAHANEAGGVGQGVEGGVASGVYTQEHRASAAGDG